MAMFVTAPVRHIAESALKLENSLSLAIFTMMQAILCDGVKNIQGGEVDRKLTLLFTKLVR